METIMGVVGLIALCGFLILCGYVIILMFSDEMPILGIFLSLLVVALLVAGFGT